MVINGHDGHAIERAGTVGRIAGQKGNKRHANTHTGFSECENRLLHVQEETQAVLQTCRNKTGHRAFKDDPPFSA